MQEVVALEVPVVSEDSVECPDSRLWEVTRVGEAEAAVPVEQQAPRFSLECEMSRAIDLIYTLCLQNYHTLLFYFAKSDIGVLGFWGFGVVNLEEALFLRL